MKPAITKVGTLIKNKLTVNIIGYSITLQIA
jgi:hypothetical protein